MAEETHINSKNRTSWPIVIVVLLLAQLMLLPSGAHASVTRRPAMIFGVSEPDAWRHNPPHASPDEIAGMVSDIGATSHEFWIHWDTVEPNPPVNGVHTYNWGPYDTMYNADVARGLRPLITVQSSPSWTWQAGLVNTWGPEQPPSPQHYPEWRSFLSQVAKRYPKAVGIQIWNEPNLAGFWGLWDPLAPTDPIAYTALLKQAYTAIKAARYSMPVIGGTIDNNGITGGGNISESDFASGMFAAGAGSYMDAISVHPYPNIPQDLYFRQGLDQARAAMSTAGVHLPIWITEVGITTTGPTPVTEQQQANLEVQLFNEAKSMPDVGAFYVHNLTEVTQDTASGEMGYGLVRGQGVGTPFPRKPAFLALKAAASPH